MEYRLRAACVLYRSMYFWKWLDEQRRKHFRIRNNATHCFSLNIMFLPFCKRQMIAFWSWNGINYGAFSNIKALDECTKQFSPLNKYNAITIHSPILVVQVSSMFHNKNQNSELFFDRHFSLQRKRRKITFRLVYLFSNKNRFIIEYLDFSWTK